MMKHAMPVGVVLSVCAVLCLASMEPVQIKFGPEAKSSAEWEVVIRAVSNGVPIVAKARQHQEVTETKPNGEFVVSTRIQGMTIESPDTEPMTMPDPAPTTVTFNQTGVVVGVQQDEVSRAELGVEARMAAIRAILYPEDQERMWTVGEKYVREVPADPKLGTVALRAEYTFEGVEKVGDWESAAFSFKTTETGVERPQHSSGQILLSLSDGWLTQMEASFNDFITPGAPEPLSGTVAFKRTR
ncbi:MAG: hypothetical protein ACK4P3_02955 [Fimbriimonadaceae bacterium]